MSRRISRGSARSRNGPRGIDRERDSREGFARDDLRRKPLGPAGFRDDCMVRLGPIIGIVLPLVLLAVNVGLGYGGIPVTLLLFVWLRAGMLLLPTPHAQGDPFPCAAPPEGGSRAP